MKKVYEQDISHALGQNLNEELWQGCVNAGAQALARIQSLYREGTKPFLMVPEDRSDIDYIHGVAKDVASRIKNIVLVGTGGSALGARAMSTLALRPGHSGNNAPSLEVLDNADPYIFEQLIKNIDPKVTLFMVVSKSGGTAEILAQTLAAIAYFRPIVGESNLKNHFHFIVEPGESPLRQLAAKYDFPVSTHNPNLGGRYSVLSLVGLLPMACIGLDIVAARDGAAEVIKELMQATKPEESAAVMGACVQAYHAKVGRQVSVMMPYGDLLRMFGHWYQQLTAESLGKDGQGVTPLAAVGTVDQHSMQQLFLDGPDDKLFNFITASYAGKGAVVDTLGLKGLEYLHGHSIGNILESMQFGTVQTFIARGKPVREIRIDTPCERAVGALMQHFMIETVLTADILGVNPYDQPAVEGGKILARSYLQEQLKQGAA